MANTTTVITPGKAMTDADSNLAGEPQQPHQAHQPLCLRRSRRETAGLIRNQLKIGQAIRNQRIASQWDLDQARVEKQEWVLRTSDLLAQVFSDESMSEYCNDWVGTILPEYADGALFVEQFEQEMKHRLGKLQSVLKMIDKIPEPPETITPADAGAAGAAAGTTAADGSHLPPVTELKAILKPSEPAVPAAAADIANTGAAPPEPDVDLTVWEPSGPAATPAAAQAPAAASAPPPAPAAPLNTVVAPVAAAAAPAQQAQAAPFPAHPAQQAHQSSSTKAHSMSTATASASASAHSNGKSSRAALALVMHGAVDSTKRADVEKLLEKLGLAPAIVEHVSAKTFAADVAMIDARGCAIVLLGNAQAEAEANDDDLMFVLGCSVGRFGGRICILHAAADAQRPAPALERAGFSPLIVDDAEGWKLQLVRQLKAAGMTVDLNRLV